jgi:hypothetical protein
MRLYKYVELLKSIRNCYRKERTVEGKEDRMKCNEAGKLKDTEENKSNNNKTEGTEIRKEKGKIGTQMEVKTIKNTQEKDRMKDW